LAGSCYTQCQKLKFRYPLESGRSLDVNFNNLKDCNRPKADMYILEEAYWKYAKANDAEGYESLWNEKFVGWGACLKTPHGKENIADWIGPLHADPSLQFRYELTKEAVRSFGNIVVAHYLVRMYMQSMVTEQPQVELTLRITHTWQRQGKSWQIITGMSALVGANCDE
jgi:hypothetical protein